MKVATPSSTSPDPTIQAPQGQRVQMGIEGGSGDPITGQAVTVSVVIVIGGVLLLPWVAGLAQRFVVWFGVWFEEYATWAFKIASGA